MPTFAANPISLGIPLTEVQQWAEQQRRGREEGVRGWREGGGSEGRVGQLPVGEEARGRNSRASQIEGRGKRRRGFQSLTVEDLKQQPVAWGREFFGWEQQDAAYSVPLRLQDVLSRVDANGLQFIGNYLRIAGVIFLLMLYRHPLALFGLLLAALLLRELHRPAIADQIQRSATAATSEISAASGFRRPAATLSPRPLQSAPDGSPGKRSLRSQLLQVALQTGIWISLFYFRVVLVCSQALLVSLAVILCHATTRNLL